MGMRLPGGINGETEFWDMLVNKKDGRCMVPEDRYNIEAFYSPTGRPGTVKSKQGYFLNHLDLQHLDASFFSMNRIEVEKLDPQQRLLLEVVWECMENGGQVGWRRKNIGCYVGVFGEDWLDMAARDTQHLGMYRITGSGDFAISNRVSYEYDLKGPSMTIRTDCSSALIGLHEACQAIYGGECHSAVVAGTNLIMTPTMTIAMTEQGVLSPTGLCKTFDAQADGYARGKAINAVYVKKLSDAIHDGDLIRAVIRATATNCDGKTPGMACPSSESHESMMRRAYRTARLPDLSQTAFIECHGTGTAIGDPLETTAVANVFGHQGIYIGSVKPNVGHSEGASGTTSLIKAALALEHKIIPPNINFSEPNPKIVVDAVSSFGPKPAINGAEIPGTARPHLLVFSAVHPESLSRIVANHRHFVEQNPHLLRDLAYTLGARREHLPHRAFCVTDAKAPLEISPITKSKSTPKTVFVFTGQGTQWAGMAKQLWEDFDAFRDGIREMDQILAGLPYPPSWTIEEELTKSDDATRIDEAEFSQLICTALQIGIVDLMSSWGVAPAAVVGHSGGEIAAAYASNAINAKAAITITYYRGQVSKKPLRSGGMLAVGMGRGAVTPYLIEGVVVACENSPDSVTLSGDKKQINKVAVAIADKQPEMFMRYLKVGTAYHSRQVRGGRGVSIESENTDPLAREVPATSWYSTMKRVGLNYGLAFQGLTDVNAGPNCGAAVASLSDRHGSDSALYQLHPTTIDLCLQLFTVGMTEGIARRLQKLYVPTAVEELYICQGTPDLRAKVQVSSQAKGSVVGDAIIMAGTRLAMVIKGGKFSPLEDQVQTTSKILLLGRSYCGNRTSALYPQTS
ncbi:MAG: hypothetical protein Q9181_005336 [Wetmoreana brouardii]